MQICLSPGRETIYLEWPYTIDMVSIIYAYTITALIKINSAMA